MAAEDQNKSAISKKFPTYRNFPLVTVHSWLVGKRQDDEAEGLWRIKDSLYDFTDFVEKHPGGEFWLKETKGTDITEIFEVHHVTNLPIKLMEEYKIRDAKKPRIYNLTLDENGFYKTLKRRVMEKLKTIDNKPKRTSDLIHFALALSIFIFAIASIKCNSLLFMGLAGLAVCWTAIASHNYFHRRDNWRMYLFNLSMMNFSNWRILHALSHHIYPNSYFDLELSLFEPVFCWVPDSNFKSLKMRYISWIYAPFFYTIAFIFEMLTRIFYSLKYVNILYWHDLISLSIPLMMWIATDANLLLCLRQWIFITMIASFIFSVIGFNAAHHDPKIFHEGDSRRPDLDWGLFQLDTIIDRGDTKGSQFLTLTHFGDHALHHLFPTLDHGILPQLYPIFYETLAEFKAQLRECNHLQHIIGQYKQLIRIEPNMKSPGI